MWFIKGRPDKIQLNAVLISLPNGYQHTTLQFRVQPKEGEDVRIAIPFPWAPHKDSGGFVLETNHTLELIQQDIAELPSGVTKYTADDVKIYDNARKLKREEVDLINVGDMYTYYNYADFGFVTVHLEPDKWYQLSYRHKISALSTLFVPCRLPVTIIMQKPEYEFKLWVINGNKFNLPTFLRKLEYPSRVMNLLPESYETLHCYAYTDGWDWETDVDIHTTNWESSDDEVESDPEDSEASAYFLERVGIKAPKQDASIPSAEPLGAT